jgi:hypothetical protein
LFKLWCAQFFSFHTSNRKVNSDIMIPFIFLAIKIVDRIGFNLEGKHRRLLRFTSKTPDWILSIYGISVAMVGIRHCSFGIQKYQLRRKYASFVRIKPHGNNITIRRDTVMWAKITRMHCVILIFLHTWRHVMKVRLEGRYSPYETCKANTSDCDFDFTAARNLLVSYHSLQASSLTYLLVFWLHVWLVCTWMPCI